MKFKTNNNIGDCVYVVKSVCLCNVLCMANCIKTLKPFSGTAVLIRNTKEKKKLK